MNVLDLLLSCIFTSFRPESSKKKPICLPVCGLYEADLDGHDVGEVLAVGCGHVDDAPHRGQGPEVALAAEQFRQL